ncbi:MAG TPA: hypothetical protein DCS30_08710 [Rhizobiales bacterium]|uniref:Uncharacterized protein n=2 Tax=Cohaesibacter gelatinilyticus TaxID=372072 RepID=A0A285PGZ2_9HYPH|nr:hypothetical protein SAMN06265368_2491 [Cohaesibacter gelatinilyticus]HAT86005.1 hypothetical protein [Hyphomicrobiales bacterium]
MRSKLTPLPKTKRRLVRVGLVFAVLCFGVLGFMELYAPSRQLNFRLDVTFEVDGQQITGSGVQKFVLSKSIMSFFPGISYDFDIYGDAVIVDLPNRSSVYVLMNSPRDDGSIDFDSGSYIFFVNSVCKLGEKAGKLGPAGYVRFVGKFTGSCDVEPKDVPVMVRFEDELDPATVERIFPDKAEQVLGADVKFIGARITITDDPVTAGIGDRLTWLSEFGSRSMVSGPSTTNPPFAQIIKHRHFREIEK